jgi:putative salt-induced outer membrane protein
MFYCLLAAAGSVQASPFYAPPPPQEDDADFSGSAELGYTHLSGNTDSQTLISKGRVTWLFDRWTHSLRGEIRSVSRNGGTSAEQYLVAGRERFDLEGPHYLFGFARWDKDRFSGYDQQFTTIGGYGRDLIDNERQRLSLEAGPGYRYDRIEDEDDASLGVAYGALAYEWDFSTSASLAQELSVEMTDDNNTSRSLSSLTARLNAHLALKLSHEIKDTSRPPEGAAAHTDNITAASLLYDW